MEGAVGGNRAEVRRRLAELGAAERQACVERAEAAFISTDRNDPASMLRPIQLLAQGVGSKELEELIGQWDSLSTAQQQQAYGVALMVCAEGTWQTQMWRLQLAQCVSEPSQGERNILFKATEGSEQALHAGTQPNVGELALAVLGPAGPPQLTILDHLERIDKLRLGSTCTSLQQASLAWFPEVTVEVQPGTTDVASMAAWLERHQAYLHIVFVDPDDALKRDAPEAEWINSLKVLPPLLVISLTTHNTLQDTAPLATLRRLQSLDLGRCELTAVPEQLSVLTAITRLNLAENELENGWQHLLPLTQLQEVDFQECNLSTIPEQLSALTSLSRLDLSLNEQLASGWQHLLPLTQLQNLGLSWCSITALPQELSKLTALTNLSLGDNSELASGWQRLQPLTQLQDLGLWNCGLTALPQQLSALTALTCLNLQSNLDLAGGWQHLQLLTQLQDLDLGNCDLNAVPARLSTLTGLTRLILSANGQMTSGWQHLLPMTQLQYLGLGRCDLTAVPAQLSALSGLTSLDLGHNSALAGGWQRLLPLTQLRHLNLQGVPLPGGVAPPELAMLRVSVAVDWRHY